MSQETEEQILKALQEIRDGQREISAAILLTTQFYFHAMCCSFPALIARINSKSGPMSAFFG